MNFTEYLKGQLVDFVECYSKYFWKTLEAVLLYTTFCFIAMVLLLKFSNFDLSSERIPVQTSLLSYIFSRYSVNSVYSLVDLAKTVFIFFVSLFSLGLSRTIAKEVSENKEFKFSFLLQQLQAKDYLWLLGTFILCAIADYCLFQTYKIEAAIMGTSALYTWVHSLLFLTRIYFPLILFSITLYKLRTEGKLGLNIRRLMLLYVSLFLFNEFAYEIFLFAKSYIFSLILVPFVEETKYFYESFIGVLLIAFYFLGFHSAMTKSLELTDAGAKEISEDLSFQLDK